MLIFEKDALRACLFEFAYLPLYILFALVGGACSRGKCEKNFYISITAGSEQMGVCCDLTGEVRYLVAWG